VDAIAATPDERRYGAGRAALVSSLAVFAEWTALPLRIWAAR
jgi:hypothetical protein